MLSKRERELIDRWRKNSKAVAIVVDPSMAKLWDKLCRAYSAVRKREIEPLIVVDMVRLEAYNLNDW